MPEQPDLVGLLYEALGEEFGVIVRTNNPQLLMSKLYAIRREDPDLEVLSLSIDRIEPSQILIIKRPNADAG